MDTHIAVWLAGAAFGICFGALWMESRISRKLNQTPKNKETKR